MLFKGKTIRAWGGPGPGIVEMDGSDWRLYQPLTFPTPPFPDYVSGHTYSAAAGASSPSAPAATISVTPSR